MEDTVAKVVVMKISAFMADGGMTFLENFAADFSAATTIAADGLASGTYTKFIIDLRANGGGYTLLRDYGIYCLTGFTGSDAEPFTMPGLIRHNKGFDWVAQACSNCNSSVIADGGNDGNARCTACDNKLGQLVGDPTIWGKCSTYLHKESTLIMQ